MIDRFVAMCGWVREELGNKRRHDSIQHPCPPPKSHSPATLDHPPTHTATIRLAFKLVLAASLLASLWFLLASSSLPLQADISPSSSQTHTPSSPQTQTHPHIVDMAAPLKHLKMSSKDAHTATVIFLHVSCRGRE